MPLPTNSLVNALLTDLYQLTMAYGYWFNGRHERRAVFDLFFRRHPFEGEFTIFTGLEEVLRFLEHYRFTDTEIDYLKEEMTGCDPAFFDWLRTLDASRIRIEAMAEGTVVFPRLPLLRVEGPLAEVQLLETTLLTLVNYPSLVATNAARFRLAAGEEKTLIEFGLRRAQGPDGGVSASIYSYIGGFDATSNVLAGQLFGIPVKGTHAHSYVQSYRSLDELKSREITDPGGQRHDFVGQVLTCRRELGGEHTHNGELAAFVSYAQAFPDAFLALVDTYDTLGSGIPNFLAVALALHRLGYQPVGIRLDSGDLAHLSREARRMFRDVSRHQGVPFDKLIIVASNEINESVLVSLDKQGHAIDSFGIGTNLVTCQAQPALGCVYKLVQIDDDPRIKLSQETAKVTIPGRKQVYRLVGKEGYPLLDLMMLVDEDPPQVDQRVLCRHPFDEAKRVYVTPSRVIPLHRCAWDGRRRIDPRQPQLARNYVLEQLRSTRRDHLRAVNPTPYKVSVSERLYDFIHHLWMEEAPVREMS